MSNTPFWSEPRHLGKQVSRCLMAFPTATTEELCQWAYPGQPRKRWHWQAVWLHCRKWGYEPTKRIRHNRIVWALRKLED